MGKLIYNKSQRSFIVAASEVLEIHRNCERIVDIHGNETVRIDKEAIVEIEDARAKFMLSGYKGEIVEWGKVPKSGKKILKKKG